jgi:hypothetical protein
VIRAIALLAVAAALAACAGPSGRHGPRELRPFAEPSTVIATELAFARLAQEQGQWTAFAKYAADDAVLFVPEPVDARQWLKKQQNPAQAVAWQPYQVWSSCDGTLAVTKGAWQRPDGTAGYFTTVWRRQERDRGYKWVLDQGDTLAEPLAAPEFVQANVADCAARGRPGGGAAPAAAKASDDGTLRYQWSVADGGARHFAVEMLVGGEMKTVLTSDVDPAPR